MSGPRMTLDVSLWDGQQRGGVPNAGTMMMPAQRMPRVARASSDPRELFVGAYARFAGPCRAFDEPGLAIIAIDEDTGRAAGLVRLTARVQRPVAAIIGRHDRCDLFLHGRDELALRQLAVVLEPVTSWQPGATNVRFRILDLRTRDGLIGEDGKRLRGLVAEGPAIVRCGGYTIFALPLGDPSDWPVSADDAWQMLPQRVYLDEVPPDIARGSLPVMPKRVHDHQSVITRTAGVRDTGMRLVHGDAAGYLELYLPTRDITFAIGESALRDGVLLGRYDRCDTQVANDDISLSRVHALLIRVEQRLMLIDTASSNGTFERGEAVRIVVIDADTELRLGKKTFARWRGR